MGSKIININNNTTMPGFSPPECAGKKKNIISVADYANSNKVNCDLHNLSRFGTPVANNAASNKVNRDLHNLSRSGMLATVPPLGSTWRLELSTGRMLGTREVVDSAGFTKRVPVMEVKPIDFCARALWWVQSNAVGDEEGKKACVHSEKDCHCLHYYPKTYGGKVLCGHALARKPCPHGTECKNIHPVNYPQVLPVVATSVSTAPTTPTAPATPAKTKPTKSVMPATPIKAPAPATPVKTKPTKSVMPATPIKAPAPARVDEEDKDAADALIAAALAEVEANGDEEEDEEGDDDKDDEEEEEEDDEDDQEEDRPTKRPSKSFKPTSKIFKPTKISKQEEEDDDSTTTGTEATLKERTRNEDKPCIHHRDFKLGHKDKDCIYGAKCLFGHRIVDAAMTTGSCLFHLTGNCKRGADCALAHRDVSEVRCVAEERTTSLRETGTHAKELGFCVYFVQFKCQKGKDCKFPHKSARDVEELWEQHLAEERAVEERGKKPKMGDVGYVPVGWSVACDTCDNSRPPGLPETPRAAPADKDDKSEVVVTDATVLYETASVTASTSSRRSSIAPAPAKSSSTVLSKSKTVCSHFVHGLLGKGTGCHPKHGVCPKNHALANEAKRRKACLHALVGECRNLPGKCQFKHQSIEELMVPRPTPTATTSVASSRRNSVTTVATEATITIVEQATAFPELPARTETEVPEPAAKKPPKVKPVALKGAWAKDKVVKEDKEDV